jgi:hypothetical protein
LRARKPSRRARKPLPELAGDQCLRKGRQLSGGLEATDGTFLGPPPDRITRVAPSALQVKECFSTVKLVSDEVDYVPSRRLSVAAVAIQRDSARL